MHGAVMSAACDGKLRSAGSVSAPVDLAAEMCAEMTAEAIRSAVRHAATIAGVRGLAS
jgi:hypothetical protein